MLAHPVTKATARPGFAHALASFRICFGVLVMWECWRFIREDRVWRNWIAPDAYISHPGPAWVSPLPEAWLELAWLGMGVAGLFVMLALFYRAAIIALVLIVGYFLLLDATEPMNRLRLILFFAPILGVLPTAQILSLDAKGPTKSIRPSSKRHSSNASDNITVPH
ncbi:HTTM domain-containing protein [Paracoccus laeviglucosivorans]|uniref:Vitamin K-dependent gamma-carboxylase n=1 Tax=Paracoccus laeviglucosivorans TaxID=1197861 RepID=A0A521EQE6_9RHOB|nr:HTTM domain-containing protein [Paracoccus laeviglucosivorans]SMO86112.1 Vitamin K-dependent gamma-carboxylase [Paracoccus laeviglucosivorans]